MWIIGRARACRQCERAQRTRRRLSFHGHGQVAEPESEASRVAIAGRLRWHVGVEVEPGDSGCSGKCDRNVARRGRGERHAGQNAFRIGDVDLAR